MPPELTELTQAEWAIIKVVWDLEPCAAPSVQEALLHDRAWSYSTVRTLMDRMAAKGILKTEKIRHMTLFRSAVTREEAQRGETLYALNTAFNGALAPMVQCLLDQHDLSPRDLEELERLIQAKRAKARGNKP